MRVTLAMLVLFTAFPAFCYDVSGLFVRTGYANIDFREESGFVRLNESFDLGKISVESQHSPIITFGKKFGDRWGVEFLIPFSPLELAAGGKGGYIEGLTVGTVDVWPAAMNLQFYPFETRWMRPYLGVGVNYCYVNNVQLNKNTTHSLGIQRVESIDAKSGIGMVLQVGMDIPITPKLMINLSSTYLEADLNASASFYANGARSTLSTQMGVKASPNLTVVGISYRF
ncbi:MAG: OmpW family protein [Halieaceae bacterium]|nr:OmpW family protein [Halieaceae bacterium]